MPRAFAVGDKVEWYNGLVRKLNGRTVRTYNGGTITNIFAESNGMFVQTRTAYHHAKRVNGRWRAYKSNDDYRLRIYRRKIRRRY